MLARLQASLNVDNAKLRGGMWEAVANALPMPVLLLNADGILFACNVAAEQFLIDVPFAQVVDGKIKPRRAKDRDILWRAWRELIDGKSRQTFAVLPKRDDVPSLVVSLSSLAPDLIMACLANLSAPPKIAPGIVTGAMGLTDNQARICVLVVQGLTTEEIATQQGISTETVRSHLKRAMTKLGVKSQAGLVSHLLRILEILPRTF